MDVKELIAKVQDNTQIWDKRIKNLSNRKVIDACWRKISLEMKTDEVALRKKWKYLRDQFSVEYSKIQNSRSGDAAESTSECKWPYFKQMLFLKDIIKPRNSSGNFKSKAQTATKDGEDGQVEDHDMRNFGGEEIDEIDSKKRRRLMTTDPLYNDRTLQREQESDDMMFFKSLLPFVSKIPMENKLRFRSRIQEVVEEYTYGGDGGYLGPSSNRPTPQSSPDFSSHDSIEIKPTVIGGYH